MVQSEIQKTRIENRLPVAREGLPFIISGTVVTILLFYWGAFWFAVLPGLLTLFTIYFFRDPPRVSRTGVNEVLSPADGTIIDIRHLVGGSDMPGRPSLKISIFMSVFNVHVNRIPVGGIISGIKYNPGRFFSANLDKASEQNENNCVTLEAVNGHRIVFVQIAGLIARRIACWIKEGDDVNAGQRFGLIRFGSRVDLYLPAECRINIRLKERVKAGITVIGYLP